MQQTTTTPPIPRRPMPRKHKGISPSLIIGGMAFVGFAGVAAMAALIAVLYLSGGRVASNVSAGGLSVGGQSLEAARAALTSQLPPPYVTLVDADRDWMIPLGELGIRVDIDATLVSIAEAEAGAAVALQYAIDFNQTQNGLIALSDQINLPAEIGRAGRSLDIPALLERLYADAAGELQDGAITLPMITLDPLPLSDAPNVSTTARTTHIVERGQELGLIARQYGVLVSDILALNNIPDPNLIYVGQQLIIPAAGVYTPAAAQAPPAPTNVGKAIVVSTGDQRIYAYENGQLVRSHLTSTGLPQTPTVLGDFRIYIKHVATDMRGADYFLPQVPYTMYFHRGYGIHGTYWHNSFGRPMSHGCVNLPIDEAQWFFNWAEVGTPVRVI